MASVLVVEDDDGLGAFAALKTENRHLIGIAISGVFAASDGARASREAGAAGFFAKPVDLSALMDFVERELRAGGQADQSGGRIKASTGTDPAREPDPPRPPGMIGDSPGMLEVYHLIARMGRTTASVLIEGETGTGKELVARAIHAASCRSHGPFVAINCAAVPRDLLESELFGSETGAFTGAVARPGRFEQAKGGTLLLDEIGDLSASAQATLLRVLDQKVVRRLGGTRDIPVDARVLAATNVDLGRAMEEGAFRADLLYRLRQLAIRLPPLRERGHDLTRIIETRLPQICASAGVVRRALSEAAHRALRSHAWPGNVRELEGALLHAVSHARGPTIEPADLPETLGPGPTSLRPGVPARPAHLSLPEACADLLSRAEREWIQLEVARNRTLGEAARALRINAKTLYEKMARYAIDRTSRRP